MFGGLALCHSYDKGLMLKVSAFKLFVEANFPYKISSFN